MIIMVGIIMILTIATCIFIQGAHFIGESVWDLDILLMALATVTDITTIVLTDIMDGGAHITDMDLITPDIMDMITMDTADITRHIIVQDLIEGPVQISMTGITTAAYLPGHLMVTVTLESIAALRAERLMP